MNKLVRKLSAQVFGHHRSSGHRAIYGTLALILGTVVIHEVHSGFYALDLVVESFGTLLQGIGTVPYIDKLLMLAEDV